MLLKGDLVKGSGVARAHANGGLRCLVDSGVFEAVGCDRGARTRHLAGTPAGVKGAAKTDLIWDWGGSNRSDLI